MKYSDDEILTWKKKTQKGLKAAGYKLTYSKDRNVFKLFPNMDKTSKHIPLEINFWNKPTTITIQYEKYETSRIDENDMGAIMLFLQNAKVLLAQHEEEYINVKFEHGFGMFSELYPFINLYMNQLGLFSVHGQLRFFTEKTRYDLITQLISFEKEASEVFRNQERDKEHSLRRFQVDLASPTSLTYTLQGIVDRTIKLQINPDKKNIHVRFWSAVHQKEIDVDLLDWVTFAEEFQQFKQEEKLCLLFEGPQINKNIESYLSEMIRGQSLDIKPKQIFDFLVSKGMTVEEMDKKSVLDFNSPVPLVKNTKIVKEMSGNRFLDRRHYKTFIFLCYGIFLFVGEKPIDEQGVNQVKTDMQLLESIEVALQAEKDWLMQIL